jgi:tetratricopeptide (TPR) repeat protein
MVLVLALTAVAACRPRDDQRTDTINPEEARQARENMSPALVAQLDSGNAAFRAGDHEGALAHYRAATEIDGSVAAVWYGVYMAEHALGHEEEAQKAMAKVQEVAPGASLVHPTTGDTAR